MTILGYDLVSVNLRIEKGGLYGGEVAQFLFLDMRGITSTLEKSHVEKTRFEATFHREKSPPHFTFLLRPTPSIKLVLGPHLHRRK